MYDPVVKGGFWSFSLTHWTENRGDLESCRDLLFPQFEEGAKSAGKEIHTLEKAVQINGGIGNRRRILNRIRKTVAGAAIKEMFDEKDPRRIESEGEKLSDEQIANKSYVCEKADELIEVFSKYESIGTSQIVWSDMSDDPDKSMEEFKTRVIPYFKRNRRN